MSLFSHVGRAAVMGAPRKRRHPLLSHRCRLRYCGATGFLAVQIANTRGWRVFGVAGERGKREYVAVMGADATIDYENDNVSAALGRLSPDGVDLVFNNIGVSLLDAILLKLAVSSLIDSTSSMRSSTARGKGALRQRSHIIDGLEKAPESLALNL